MKKKSLITNVLSIALIIVLAFQVMQTKQKLNKQTEIVNEQNQEIKKLKLNAQELKVIAEKLAEDFTEGERKEADNQ